MPLGQAPPSCSMGERTAKANARNGQSAQSRAIMRMVRFVPQRLNQPRTVRGVLSRGSEESKYACPGRVVLVHPWPRHKHNIDPYTQHRQPGRQGSRQTHPRRYALRTSGDGQQPDPPASVSARALSRDGVWVRAHRARALGLRRVKQMCLALNHALAEGAGQELLTCGPTNRAVTEFLPK